MVRRYESFPVVINLSPFDLLIRIYFYRALKICELENFRFNLVDTNYKVLYYNSKPLLNTLSCCHRDLKLIGTKVSFAGKVGKENRSVKSVLPFPTGIFHIIVFIYVMLRSLSQFKRFLTMSRWIVCNAQFIGFNNYCHKL